MASTGDIEQQLEKQQADYLSRMEASGSLPKVISEEWAKAGGAETAKLRSEEADLLTNYVSAGAEAREKYKDVWDPFARDRLASQQVALNYKPIADIRSELAMRAEALGVATSSATAMYGAETERAGTAMGFTESAYERALAKEQEETRQRERAEDIAREQAQWEAEMAASAAKSSSSGSSSSSSSTSKTAVNDAVKIMDEIDKAGEEYGGIQDNLLSQEEAIAARDRIMALYDLTESEANDLLYRAGLAGGYKEWYGYDDQGNDVTGSWGSQF